MSGDKWQSKTQFLVSFYPCLSIVESIFDCRLCSVIGVNVSGQTNGPMETAGLRGQK